MPGQWSEQLLASGLQRLLALTSAAAAAGAGGGGAARGARAGGAAAALTAALLDGSTAAWQMRHVREYAAVQLRGGAGRRALLLLSLCFWEGREALPA